jgi:hypothetical protein
MGPDFAYKCLPTISNGHMGDSCNFGYFGEFMLPSMGMWTCKIAITVWTLLELNASQLFG